MTLRQIRFLKGFNQYDIALKTGIPQSRISLIERGYAEPKEHEKQKIAKALNCRTEELFPGHQSTNEETEPELDQSEHERRQQECYQAGFSGQPFPEFPEL